MTTILTLLSMLLWFALADLFGITPTNPLFWFGLAGCATGAAIAAASLSMKR